MRERKISARDDLFKNLGKTPGKNAKFPLTVDVRRCKRLKVPKGFLCFSRLVECRKLEREFSCHITDFVYLVETLGQFVPVSLCLPTCLNVPILHNN